MKVTSLGRRNGEQYELRKGYSDLEDREYLIRTYDDGVVTVSTRPGRERRDVQWSPEVEVAAVIA